MKVCLEHLNRGQDGWLNIIAKRCQNSVHAKFAEGWLGELRRITLPRTPLNRANGTLIALPLFGRDGLRGSVGGTTGKKCKPSQERTCPRGRSLGKERRCSLTPSGSSTTQSPTPQTPSSPSRCRSL